MRPIGRLTAENWVAHLLLVLAAAAATAVLASRAEGELARKVITVVLGVLAVMLILQTVVESAPDAPRSYRFPYPICAAASIIMIEGQMMQTEQVVAGMAAVSGFLFAIGISVLAVQVRGLRRSMHNN